MAASKVTFTLDETTIRFINEASDLLSKPKSLVVREAVQEYRERIGKMSERERIRTLRAFDALMPRISPRPRAAVDAEIGEIRNARRHSGRWSETE